jgi:hypothetical protein
MRGMLSAWRSLTVMNWVRRNSKVRPAARLKPRAVSRSAVPRRRQFASWRSSPGRCLCARSPGAAALGSARIAESQENKVRANLIQCSLRAASGIFSRFE